MNTIRIGLDIGSTTIKMIALNHKGDILFKDYMRHFSSIKETVVSMFKKASKVLKAERVTIVVTGSGGFSIAKKLGLQFVQEVVACTKAVEEYIPHTDVAIELGGEDAKITYFSQIVEQRMNGTCAGGTGSFIDQMATLLRTNASGLNELAKHYENIYPIASRCGVFAKSDVQPLLNDGAKREDVAVSVLQAVVNQIIAGLSQGKNITGNVALLGGPLAFLSELRERFKKTLDLSDDTMIVPEDAEYFVAKGAAISTSGADVIPFNVLSNDINQLNYNGENDALELPPLFAHPADYEAFKQRHALAKVDRASLDSFAGEAFLGIDAGSTTTKLVLTDSAGRLLYDFYGPNKGNPLQSVKDALCTLYAKLNGQTSIRYSAVTGYGEQLLKNALRIDHGEIETVCHAKAASHFSPEVSFVLDIGGQDMKSMVIDHGVIETIMLNEACSSGCGSFIETFASSVNLPIAQFAEMGVHSEHPVDLGTRCTVFMNSRVKQAQKEGSSPADISAGISLSVIKNALYKVIRLRSVEEMGEHIVVQGGTFYNDSVLRAFEQLVGREVVRPDIAGLMGAYGAALLAIETADQPSSLLKPEQLNDFSLQTMASHCEQCGNHCLLTKNTFNDGRFFITGNRCERGAGAEKATDKLPNMYAYKLNRLFRYQPLNKEDAPRGEIGLPRVLNMYEDYPFWFTFFTELGYRVILSRKSSHQLFLEGMDSIPSESVCYPAKLTHGHVEDLIRRGVKRIFYPCIAHTPIEDSLAGNHYSCPIVTSYPESLRVNMDTLQREKVQFMNPFLPLDHELRLRKQLYKLFKSEGISQKELNEALDNAYREKTNFRNDIKKQGLRIIRQLEEQGQRGIVLCGRPYHLDQEINHGLPEMINSMGLAVLTEDSIDHLQPIERPLRVVDQWTYHNRMYRAASYVARHKNLEVVQLVSFGCGLDAITSDQLKEILDQYGKIFTLVKIDEISNLGAARIRIRSLLASLDARARSGFEPVRQSERPEVARFTAEMRENYTILAPQMSPIHFDLIEPAIRHEGYQLKILPSVDKKAIDAGLRFVHNDACYPSIITIGQIMSALLSGQYDLNRTAVMITQTGGGCRATNYIAFIRKALFDAGMEQVPVISLNAVGLEKQPGFSVSPSMLTKLIQAVIYGDLLMRMLYRIRPYEAVLGSANALHKKWTEKLAKDLVEKKNFKQNVYAMVQAFDELPIDETLKKPKVGIVGEILVKFHPMANNQLVELLEAEGAEAVMPDLLDFLLYCSYNNIFKYDKLSGSLKSKMLSQLSIEGLEWMRRFAKDALEKSKRFHAPQRIENLAAKAAQHLSIGNHTGEGWFLTAEMIELIEEGVPNILCLQPFACLPNHITGKGMIKTLRQSYPMANIVPIDYDPGASEVNQLNRIKLMLSTAFKMLH